MAGHPSRPSPAPSSSAALFAALGLDPGGPLDDGTLRRAFTATARRTHPDKQGGGRGGGGGGGGGGNDTTTAAAFAAARAAFEALADPADRARHASAARTAGLGTGGASGRGAPADVDLDDFEFEAGGGRDVREVGGGGGESRASPPGPPAGPVYWLACRCGGRYAVPEADLADAADAAAARGSGGGGGGGGHAPPTAILVPCDGCSLVVRAHFCAAG